MTLGTKIDGSSSITFIMTSTTAAAATLLIDKIANCRQCDIVTLQQTVRSPLNVTDTNNGRVSFNIVRSGVVGDVLVQWRLGLEAVSDFYPPLDGSVLFHDVINLLRSLLFAADLCTF